MTKTCLHRIFDGCPCKRDYENHYPNNKNCSRYYEISLFTFEVVDERKREKTKNALDRKI